MWQDTRRDHDTPGRNWLGIGEGDLEPAVGGLDLRHRDITHIGHQLLDIPVAVVEEYFDWQRRPPLDTFDSLRPAVSREIVPVLRARHVRAVRLGFQVHADRHVGAPGIHRAADDEMVDPPPAKVRGDRQAVGASTDNEHLAGSHVTLPSGADKLRALTRDGRCCGSQFSHDRAQACVEPLDHVHKRVPGTPVIRRPRPPSPGGPRLRCRDSHASALNRLGTTLGPTGVRRSPWEWAAVVSRPYAERSSLRGSLREANRALRRRRGG